MINRRLRFVLNSHGLGFDKYSMLCIKSIRYVCGNDVLVSAYCPTNLPPPSDRALRFYERHNVDVVSFHNEFLPDKLTDLHSVPARHLTYNKLYTLHGIEEGERRIFVDADIIFLRDPLPYLTSISEPAACVAVDTPESFSDDWRALYQRLNVPFPSETIEVWKTYVYGNAPEPAKVMIPPFLSSGVICADHRSSLPMHWLEVCREIEGDIKLLSRSFFVDQVGLSVALQKTGQPWHLLPRKFNTTYEVWRFVDDPVFFHYVTLDALAAGTARFPRPKQVMNEIVPRLAREDGLDLRFQLLTQWPRWYRRGLGILSRYTERFIGRTLVARRERT